MSILNRRNAVLGWVAWALGKRVLKRKAKSALPAVAAQTRKPKRSAIAGLLAGAAGVAAFVRSRSRG